MQDGRKEGRMAGRKVGMIIDIRIKEGMRTGYIVRYVQSRAEGARARPGQGGYRTSTSTRIRVSYSGLGSAHVRYTVRYCTVQ